MTRREQLEAKAEKRHEWAEKAHEKSDQRFGAVARLADQIPLGQPILVGHHSEKHARRDAERIRGGMEKGVEEMRLAEHHEAKASGIERQLETCVFSDDTDAVEQLKKRIAENMEKRERRKTINKLFKKGDASGLAAMGLDLEKLRIAAEGLPSFDKQPFPAYSITNLSARIRADEKRVKEVEARQARTVRAEAAGGVTVEGGEYITVTFAEKPEYAVISALKAAGFRWCRGSWCGMRAQLPSGIVTA